jgi:hypothetical protein
MNWQKQQVKLLNKIKRGEEDATARRAPAAVAPVRDWWLAAEEQARKAETERLERDRKISAAHQARAQQQAQAGQDAQRAWAEVRNALRSAVVEAQQAVAACEARINGADFEDAVRAAAELVVHQRRLENAQTSFAQHSQRSPL